MQDVMTIGVVAGVGPLAGLDLLLKIVQETVAARDQDHLTIASLSQPHQIPDRTQYLLGEATVNPAHAIAQQLTTLARLGARVAGIPCNTAHAPAIFDVIRQELQAGGTPITLLHMIAEVVQFLLPHAPHIRRVGVLSTIGTYLTRVYPQHLEPAGFTALVPPEDMQRELIHSAVYDPTHGIKTQGAVTPTARAHLLTGIRHLQMQGADAIILGCTEMPLAITQPTINGTMIIDPTRILARALIQAADPAKLRPLAMSVLQDAREVSE
jgi:aspartate racemase